eukprot:5246015-Karenia_brevis.AAC.1
MVCAAEFIHTGIRHRVSQSFNYVRLDQEEYVTALKPITSPTLASLRDDQLLEGNRDLDFLSACFSTFLGAAAWMLLTRMDM